jgi:hypothetical protein
MLLLVRNKGDVPRGASEIGRGVPGRKASFLQPALEFLMRDRSRHPPARCVHTIHDIGPFSAVATPQAGIDDEFGLSRFARGSHGIERMHVRTACG